MKLLLDTHILIWALADDPKLPKKARELILDTDNAIYVSVVSLWEVVVKHSIHPNEIPYSGKKGTTWHFGYKAHVGVYKDTGLSGACLRCGQGIVSFQKNAIPRFAEVDRKAEYDVCSGKPLSGGQARPVGLI